MPIFDKFYEIGGMAGYNQQFIGFEDGGGPFEDDVTLHCKFTVCESRTSLTTDIYNMAVSILEEAGIANEDNIICDFYVINKWFKNFSLSKNQRHVKWN
jgi:hypothetical protein